MTVVCWVIGHYASCNMGDKYPAIAVAHNLIGQNSDMFGSWEKGLKDIYFVNFSADTSPTRSEMTFTVDGKRFHISDPVELQEKGITADFAVITTGSMDYGSPYVEWLSSFVKSGVIQKLVIWGGFSRGDKSFEEFKETMAFLNHQNINYFARSVSDKHVYDRITNSISGDVAGDAMTWWTTPEGRAFGRRVDIDYHQTGILDTAFPAGGTVAIPSVYAFRFNTELWEKICTEADVVVCIDTVSDNQVSNYIKKTKKPILKTFQPWELLHIIEKCDRVISGRLHGSVISASAGIPTFMVVTDNAESGKGSFKFDAVGTGPYAEGIPLCGVLRYEDFNNPLISDPVHLLNAEIYSNVTNVSFKKLSVMLRKCA